MEMKMRRDGDADFADFADAGRMASEKAVIEKEQSFLTNLAHQQEAASDASAIAAVRKARALPAKTAKKK